MAPSKRGSARQQHPKTALDVRTTLKTLKDINRLQGSLLDSLEKAILVADKPSLPGSPPG